MKTSWTLGSFLLTVVTAGAMVQAQSGTSNHDQQSTITITGCLRPAGPGAVGTSGSAATRPGGAASGTAAAADANGLILVNARVGAAPGGGSGVTTIAPPGSGTNESAARAGSTQPSAALSGAINSNGEPIKSAGATYAVRSNLAELPRHVGEEVEVSGRLIPSGAAGAAGSSTTTTGSTTTTTSSADASHAAGTAGLQQIEVQTVRMIASVCTAK